MQKQHGVLIVNMGTPNSNTPKAVKKYLARFLADKHIVDLNHLFWLPLLHLVIIPKRIKPVTAHYQQIAINGKSPLRLYSQSLCKNLQALNPNQYCKLALTYSEPELESALQELKNCSSIKVISLFPQYSTTTTQSVIDQINTITNNWQNAPNIAFLYDYADHPAYINALLEQIKSHFTKQTAEPDVLLLSYHGIPLRYIENRNDPYVQRCELTTQLLESELAKLYPQIEIKMVYQSRFGKDEWTTPNLSDVLIDLAKQQKSVAVMCPGFAIDCLETLYEIDIENREIFTQAGGKSFTYIPALNDNKIHCGLLKQLV
ncbi:ferrochelatase [Orbaceae bacterium ac157xtp]